MRYPIMIVGSLGIACILAGLSSCSNPEKSALSAHFSNHECAPKTGKKLYVYGDSVSHGWDTPSYPGLVACYEGLELINASIGGTAITSSNQAAKMLSDVWESDSVIMFAPGVNDAILFGTDATHQATYESLLTQVLNKIAAEGQTAIIGTAISSCDEPRFGPNSTKALYSAITRDLVARFGTATVFLADYEAGFSPDRENTHDCIHPNAYGNTLLADIARKALQ